MLLSSGELKAFATHTYAGPSPSTVGMTWVGSNNMGDLSILGRCTTYAEIYKSQVWVYTVVHKLATATARLPLKVYARTDTGRREAPESGLGQLLRRPNPKHDPFFFWLLTASTHEVYGEVVWVKVRDRRGRVVEVWPLHPSRLRIDTDVNGNTLYIVSDTMGQDAAAVPPEDVVHFRSYNPDNFNRGLSPLEPLRQTLFNEDAARRATSSFWTNGARPAVALTHPSTLSEPAAERLKARWDAIAAGADNTGKTVVLEEGMKPEVMMLSAEEAQYIETRKLNREEVCGAYDVPPPVVHILDHATFSNITEQMRSMYRDTMAPRLGMYESVIEHGLRPEFDEDVYAEFLLDEVLRGDFEVRADAKQKAINSGQMTPNEARRLENLPPLPGGDLLYINSALIPLAADAAKPANETIPVTAARSVLGRLSWQKTLDDVDPDALTAGLNGSTGAVLAALAEARAAGDGVPGLRDRVKALIDPEMGDPVGDIVKAIKEAPPPVVNVTVQPPTPDRTTRRVERDERGDIVRIIEESV